MRCMVGVTFTPPAEADDARLKVPLRLGSEQRGYLLARDRLHLPTGVVLSLR